MDSSRNSNIQKTACNVDGDTVKCTLPSSECLKPKAKNKARRKFCRRNGLPFPG
jgi:hypothetical protein